MLVGSVQTVLVDSVSGQCSDKCWLIVGSVQTVLVDSVSGQCSDSVS